MEAGAGPCHGLVQSSTELALKGKELVPAYLGPIALLCGSTGGKRLVHLNLFHCDWLRVTLQVCLDIR